MDIPANLIDQILEGATGPSEAEQQITEEHRRQVAELAAQYRACFSTPAGQSVLVHLRSITLEQPTWVPATSLGCDGQAAEQLGWVREGQNEIVRHILKYVGFEEAP